MADFRQYYGVGLFDVPPWEAAELATQLPASSRLVLAVHPELRWPVDQQMLLSRIEYELAILVYRDTKDAKARRNEPKQILPPAVKKMAEEANTSTQTIRGYAMPIDELDKMFRVKSHE